MPENLSHVFWPLSMYIYSQCTRANCDSLRLLVVTSQFSVFQQRYLENGSSTHCHFTMKLILIIAWSFMNTQHLHSIKFTLVNKAVLFTACMLSVSVGHHFQITINYSS